MKRVSAGIVSVASILLLGTFQGCVPPRIVSVRDPEFHGRVTRLLVLIHDDGSDDAEILQAALHRRLNARRINHRIQVVTDTGEHRDVPTGDASFTPDATLRIEPTVTIFSGSNRYQVYVDASLYLSGETMHRIWRAKVVHGTGRNLVDASGLPQWAPGFAARVVDQLVVDGVVGAG